jgi:cell division septal protein FtsQ
MTTKTASRSPKTTAPKKAGGKTPVKRPAAKRVQSPPSQMSRIVRENLHWIFLSAAAVVVGVVLFWGYRKVTASDVFTVKKIDVAGEKRTPKDAVEKSVRTAVQSNGVWNADLSKIQKDLEQLSWVKSASVSRVLPDGLRVRLTEREPRSVVRLESGAKVWVDDEARTLGAVDVKETQQFVIYGWNEGTDTEAAKKNQDRVRLYLKLLEEWRKLEIANRVTSVDLLNLQDIEATVDQNGAVVAVQMGNQDFGQRLKSSLALLENLAKTDELNNVEKIIAYDRVPVIRYKNLNSAGENIPAKKQGRNKSR